MSILASIFRPLAYISLPYILLRSLSSTSPACRYYIRLGVYFSTMATVGACSSVIAATMAMVGEKYNVNYVVARFFYGVAGRLMEIDVQVEGEEYLGTRPAVLMSNHQSALDILVVGRLVFYAFLLWCCAGEGTLYCMFGMSSFLLLPTIVASP